jgi:hypothetical protein
MDGAVEATGAAAATGAVGQEATVSEPAELEAVTSARTVDHTSALVSA